MKQNTTPQLDTTHVAAYDATQHERIQEHLQRVYEYLLVRQTKRVEKNQAPQTKDQ